MKRSPMTIICAALAFVLLCSCGENNFSHASADYLINTVASPKTGVSGGDWTVFALARSGFLPEEWREGYFSELETRFADENFYANRNTEYARMALAVRALGQNPRDVVGYDLLAPLEDVEKTAAQGVSSIAYALLALGDDGTDDLRREYVERLLSYQLPDGGFAPMNEAEPDADLTAIALQALSQSGSLRDTQNEISAALSALSTMQKPDGSFSNYGASTSESTAQAVIALCSLGISPDKDSRFVKAGGKSAYTALMSFYRSGGGFAHTVDGKADVIATEQALCALAAMSLYENGAGSLFYFGRENEKPGCSISVRCDELLDKLSLLDPSKHALIPSDGVIYENENAAFTSGESVFDLLKRELKNSGIHLEFTLTPAVGTAYIEGISNLYEFDVGELSGWLYSVNGEYPGFSCSQYTLADGDVVVFEFVCSKRGNQV